MRLLLLISIFSTLLNVVHSNHRRYKIICIKVLYIEIASANTYGDDVLFNVTAHYTTYASPADREYYWNEGMYSIGYDGNVTSFEPNRFSPMNFRKDGATGSIPNSVYANTSSIKSLHWPIKGGGEFSVSIEGGIVSVQNEPPSSETYAATVTNPYDENIIAEIDGNYYEIAKNSSISIQSDTEESQDVNFWSTNDIFGDVNLDTGEFEVFTTVGEPLSTGTTNNTLLPTGYDPETDPESLFSEATVIPEDLPYAIEERNGEIWMVQKSDGKTVGHIDSETSQPTFYAPTLHTTEPTLQEQYQQPEQPSESEILADTANQTTVSDSEYMHELSEVDGNQGNRASDYNFDQYLDVPVQGNFSTTGAAPNFQITMPESMGGASFDLNPFRQDRLGGILPPIREFGKWVILIGLAAYVANHIYNVIADLNKSNQARGHNVFGGTGGQATALIAAAAICATVLTVVGALVATLTGDFAIPSLYSLAGTNPLASISSSIVWMLDQVFPLAVILGALVARVTLPAASALSVAGAGAIIRFIVP